MLTDATCWRKHFCILEEHTETFPRSWWRPSYLTLSRVGFLDLIDFLVKFYQESPLHYGIYSIWLFKHILYHDLFHSLYLVNIIQGAVWFPSNIKPEVELTYYYA